MRRPATVRRVLATLVVLSVIALPTARAQSADSAAVLDVVQRLFSAMAQRDTASARRLLLPGASFVSTRAAPSASGSTTTRTQSDTAFLRGLATGTDRLLERGWSPVVMLRGSLATVWTPYDFHLNGRRTHCGIDAFTLVRGAAGWQVAGIAYTVEQAGCVDSPLGPVQ